MQNDQTLKNQILQELKNASGKGLTAEELQQKTGKQQPDIQAALTALQDDEAVHVNQTPTGQSYSVTPKGKSA